MTRKELRKGPTRIADHVAYQIAPNMLIAIPNALNLW